MSLTSSISGQVFFTSSALPQQPGDTSPPLITLQCLAIDTKEERISVHNILKAPANFQPGKYIFTVTPRVSKKSGNMNLWFESAKKID